MKKLLKYFFNSDIGRFIIGFLASFYIRLVYATSKWQHYNTDNIKTLIQNNKPFIVVFWHGHMLMMAKAWIYKKSFYMLSSSHKDGKLIARTVNFLGIKTIYGSTNKKGDIAGLKIIKHLKNNKSIIGLTPDGPKGPCHKVSQGVLQLARLAKVPIVPMGFSAKKMKILKSWDRFRLVFPFNKGAFNIGKPYYYDAKFDLEKNTLNLQQNMLACCQEADDMVAEFQAFKK